MAARSASRGGSSRMAVKLHGAGGHAGRFCQAARPTPVPRQTSHARAIRWLSSGFSRAAVAGSTWARLACRAAEPLVGQQAARLGAGVRAGVGDVGEPIGQRREIQAGAAGQDRQPALTHGLLPSRTAPGRATTPRCRPRPRGGCRRGDAERGPLRPAWDGR